MTDMIESDVGIIDEKEDEKGNEIKNISDEQLMSIINDTFLINFNDKKCGHASLVGVNEINKWKSYFKEWHSEDLKFPHINTGNCQDISDKCIEIETLCSRLWEAFIIEVLKIGNGVLSLCGNAVARLLLPLMIDDYNIFFHCSSAEKCDSILLDCINFIESKCKHSNFHYVRFKEVLTIWVNHYTKINFIKHIYQSKDHVLLSFDLAADRIGFNLTDGLFSTVCGGIAIASKIFPFNAGQRTHAYMLHTNQLQNYDDYTWKCIATNNDHKVFFSGGTYADIDELKENIIESNFNKSKLFTGPLSQMKDIKPSTVEKFLGDSFVDYAICKCHKHDDEAADNIWKARCNYYLNRSKEIATTMKNNPWKYEDESFRNVDPREWYGDNYKPVIIGINMPRFQAVMDCRKNIDYISILPKEIFKLICQYWFEFEVEAARERLLNLG